MTEVAVSAEAAFPKRLRCCERCQEGLMCDFFAVLLEGSSVQPELLCGTLCFPFSSGWQVLGWLWDCQKLTWVQRLG